ncbi:H/ACA ribonucleoprotein complex non-core subunit NAF1-like [Lampris incognitus]|uniref:H/ACA ribonucleoprotein complex non-core subunit NAF1-like n=1 Tax=Lampris incognitus TaxID=2546036 RepID=UPI0024B491FC|nr:H/ACA ribonucleoprotein complex non-core subunit NAF1-like [Lampris incognitus]
MASELSEGKSPTSSMAEEEAMDITVTTQLENLNVTPEEITPAVTHKHLDGETNDAHTGETAATPSEDDVCTVETASGEGDGFCVGKDPKHDSSSEDSDSDSSSSSSSSSPAPFAPVLEEEDDDEGFSQPALKTRDEVLPEELPAVEEVCVSLPEDAELQPVGTVSSIIQKLVIVQSLRGTPPLTDDSFIFDSDRQAMGKVFEVFGPVSSPLYVLRFNSVEQISNKGLTVGQSVFYTPSNKEYTGYILTQQLKMLKGSDASWKNDQEPPLEALDYSDDELEQQAKRKKKLKAKKKDTNGTDNAADITHDASFPQHDAKGPQQRQAGPHFRHLNPKHVRAPFHHAHHRPPRHAPPVYLPPPCPYPPHPPPFPPPAFPLYPPPPLPPFSHPPMASPPWPPHSVPPPLHFSHLPPPPPPPPPPSSR